MALTTAKICALLLGGAVAGSYGTVAVQKAKAPVAKVKGKPRASPASRPRVVRPEPAPLAASPILDCPLPAPSFDANLDYRLEPTWSAPFPVATPTGGGVWWGSPTPPTSTVPAPDVWVMLVAGFGLVGASLRKKGTEHGTV